MIEVSIGESISVESSAPSLIEQAAEAALLHMGRRGSIGVLLTSEQEIQQLNRDFRGIDRVTDVLSFPSMEGEWIAAPSDGYLGDIAICLARAAEQAATYGHSIERELAFLTVHGALHLMGLDHMTEPEEREMRTHQAEIMEEMGLRIG